MEKRGDVQGHICCFCWKFLVEQFHQKVALALDISRLNLVRLQAAHRLKGQQRRREAIHPGFQTTPQQGWIQISWQRIPGIHEVQQVKNLAVHVKETSELFISSLSLQCLAQKDHRWWKLRIPSPRGFVHVVHTKGVTNRPHRCAEVHWQIGAALLRVLTLDHLWKSPTQLSLCCIIIRKKVLTHLLNAVDILDLLPELRGEPRIEGPHG
mmetsp:Transcript_57176/g.90659  ORF Transcript_57176/g.90659 Transcript_57176/m.90659 type:complete len:210 (-) Transcript_57176:362-991(-)